MLNKRDHCHQQYTTKHRVDPWSWLGTPKNLPLQGCSASSLSIFVSVESEQFSFSPILFLSDLFNKCFNKMFSTNSARCCCTCESQQRKHWETFSSIGSLLSHQQAPATSSCNSNGEPPRNRLIFTVCIFLIHIINRFIFYV